MLSAGSQGRFTIYFAGRDCHAVTEEVSPKKREK
jgi:hypothetical protein